VEGKKEMFHFSARLSLFKIGHASTFVIEERRALVWCVSDYASNGRNALLETCLLLAMKVDVTPFPY
jgi:hypothetical protein